MSKALSHDVLLEEQAPLSVRQPSTAPARLVPDPLVASATADASIWKRLDRMHLSDMERRAAIDALLLGRDIGKALQYLERVVRRWLGGKRVAKHVRSASFRHLIRMRRARVPAKRLR